MFSHDRTDRTPPFATALDLGRTDEPEARGERRLSRRSLLGASAVGAAGLASAAIISGNAGAATSAQPAYLPLGGGTMLGPIVGFQDKGGQVFNVMAYGAVGDGKTNDTAAIQATINAAAGSHDIGGIVYFPNPIAGGSYMFSNLTLYARVALEGAGPQLTVLQRISGSTGNALQEASTGKPNGALGITISNLMIWGNGTSGDGINLGSAGGQPLETGAYLEHVYVWGFPSGSGFHLNGNAIWYADLWANTNKVGFTLNGESNMYFGLWPQYNTEYEIYCSEPWSHFFGIHMENYSTSGTNPALVIAGDFAFYQGIHMIWSTGGRSGGTKPEIIQITGNVAHTIIRDVIVLGNASYADTIHSANVGVGTGTQELVGQYILGSGTTGPNWYQNTATGTITQHN
jgi:hypothetical protein